MIRSWPADQEEPLKCTAVRLVNNCYTHCPFQAHVLPVAHEPFSECVTVPTPCASEWSTYVWCRFESCTVHHSREKAREVGNFRNQTHDQFVFVGQNWQDITTLPSGWSPNYVPILDAKTEVQRYTYSISCYHTKKTGTCESKSEQY